MTSDGSSGGGRGSMTPQAAEPPVVSASDLFRMASRYLARRAASTEQLRRYLIRKSRGHGPATQQHAEPNGAAIDEVLARIVRAGLVDDHGLAQTRAAALVRKGLSPARMRRDLKRQGFDLDDAKLDGMISVDEEDQAQRYAERHRLGPYASGRRRPSFDRDVRALVRGGFGVDLAVRLMTKLGAAAPVASPDDDRLTKVP